MLGILNTILLTAFFALANASTSPRIAVAVLSTRHVELGQNVAGTIQFTETNDGLHVAGAIVGLSPGYYGFHVHELGDIVDCDNSGGHFNPEDTNHGGQNHTVRHVGDLGNVLFVGNDTVATATVNITDHLLTLRDRNNILGRTLVLHAQPDDLGLGGHEQSLTTGNAGPRVACGVIGIRGGDWNSAVTSSPSILLFIVAASISAYFQA